MNPLTWLKSRWEILSLHLEEQRQIAANERAVRKAVEKAKRQGTIVPDDFDKWSK